MTAETVWHHSNSRRFTCDCGRVYDWGYEGYWRPWGRELHCLCGRRHVRSSQQPPPETDPSRESVGTG